MSPRDDQSAEEFDFAARLRDLRMAAGLTRQELADRAGLSERSVRDIENGRRPRVQDKTLLLLCEALGCELADLAPDMAPSRPAAGDAPTDAAVDDAPGAATPDPATATTPRPRRLLPIALAVAVGALVSVAVLAWFAGDRATWAIVEGDLVMRDAVLKREMWRIDQMVNVHGVQPSPWSDHTLIVAFAGEADDGDCAWEVDRRTGRKLHGFDIDETPVRTAFGDEPLAEGQGFSCSQTATMDHDGDGVRELVLRFTHGKYYPAALALFGPGGERLAQYTHRGHLSFLHIEDIDGDGCDELLAFGTNNDPAYQGASVIYLDRDGWSGASVDPDGYPGRGPVGDIADGARYRLVLPAFGDSVMTRLGSLRLRASSPRIYRNGDGETQIMFSVCSKEPASISVICDGRLQPVAVTSTDGILAEVRDWEGPYGSPGHFPSQEYLDDWITRARWSGLDQGGR